MLSGGVEILRGGTDAGRLGPGDIFYVSGLKRDIRLRGLCEETQLLYFADNPVYENMRRFSGEMHALIDEINRKDNVTARHSLSVMEISVALSERLGARELSLDELVAASMFHDVGKCLTPDAILGKAGRLTPEEYRVIRRHPCDSAAILRPRFGDAVAAIAFSHHERLDGSGYPNGIRQIPYGARLVAVADSFDAMISPRPYNRVRSKAEAAAELASMSGKYDSEIAAALCALAAENAL